MTVLKISVAIKGSIPRDESTSVSKRITDLYSATLSVSLSSLDVSYSALRISDNSDDVTPSSQGASDTTGHSANTSAATASTNVRPGMMGVGLVIYGCLSFHGNASWHLFKEPGINSRH